jgi:drug/metabolite transporter (DMT)-like permease
LLSTVLVVGGGSLASALLLPAIPLGWLTAPAPESWPFIAASSLTKTLYYLLLIEAYRSGDMSHAYPLMRGSAPLLVALVNGFLTGEHLSRAQWLAVCLICGGVLAMVAARSPATQPAASQRRATVFALATACVIALYTMIDGAGVRRSGAPAAYTPGRRAAAAAAGRRCLHARLLRHRAVGHDAGASGGDCRPA